MLPPFKISRYATVEHLKILLHFKNLVFLVFRRIQYIVRNIVFIFKVSLRFTIENGQLQEDIIEFGTCKLAIFYNIV